MLRSWNKDVFGNLAIKWVEALRYELEGGTI